MYKVLVIEDEPIIRKGLIYSFNWADMNCVVVGEAENGEEGLAKIFELKPDIVIVDINMPVLNGLDMIEQSIEKINYSIIIVSGYNEFEYAKKAVKFGVSEYLLKPLDHKELASAIRNAIEQCKMRRLYSEAKKNKATIQNIKIVDYDSDLRSSDEIVAQMLQYITDNYMNKILMTDLAKTMNYSVTLLNRRFKENLKCTFNDYLNRYRIQKAIEMILAKEKYIYDIAEVCGFNNYKYFNVVFMKYIGYSPKEFYAAIK